MASAIEHDHIGVGFAERLDRLGAGVGNTGVDKAVIAGPPTGKGCSAGKGPCWVRNRR
jgi:hypothetical protein